MAVELDGKGGPLNDADSEVVEVEEPDGSAEAALEGLADQIAGIISASPDEEREALHDYAVSLVRDALPVAADRTYGSLRTATGNSEAASRGSGPQALGYGVLLLPVGFFLFWIFPFIGVMLFVAGSFMVAWGVIASILGGRKRPQAEMIDGD